MNASEARQVCLTRAKWQDTYMCIVTPKKSSLTFISSPKTHISQLERAHILRLKVIQINLSVYFIYLVKTTSNNKILFWIFRLESLRGICWNSFESKTTENDREFAKRTVSPLFTSRVANFKSMFYRWALVCIKLNHRIKPEQPLCEFIQFELSDWRAIWKENIRTLLNGATRYTIW